MPRTRDAVILFADIVGSARLSDVLTPHKYDTVVRAFQLCVADVFKMASAEMDRRTDIVCVDGGVRGDEGVLIVAPRASGVDLGIFCARLAIETAVKIAVLWLCSPQNCERIRVKASPIGVSIGLHFGPVMVSKHPRGIWSRKRQRWVWESDEKDLTPEGFSINFAKRVESASRHGSTGLAISQSFLSLCRRCGIPIHVGRPLSGVETKGFEQREPIYEMEGQDVLLDVSWARKRRSFREIVMPAFQRDPGRARWLLELAIEEDFRPVGIRAPWRWHSPRSLSILRPPYSTELRVAFIEGLRLLTDGVRRWGITRLQRRIGGFCGRCWT